MFLASATRARVTLILVLVAFCLNTGFNVACEMCEIGRFEILFLSHWRMQSETITCNPLNALGIQNETQE
jgi:hypothetical protein